MTILLLAWAAVILWPVLLGIALWRGLKRGRGPGALGWTFIVFVTVFWGLGIHAFLWEPQTLEVRRVEVVSRTWSGAPLRIWLVAFGLLGTVPVQEYVQSTFTWTNDVVYGFRALVEEGTEIVGVLLFLAVTSRAFTASSAGRPHVERDCESTIAWRLKDAVAHCPECNRAVREVNVLGRNVRYINRTISVRPC